MATLSINGTRETRIEGDTEGIPHRITPDAYPLGLVNIGFWLSNWRCADSGGRNRKSHVFIPWTSCLYLETLEKVRGK